MIYKICYLLRIIFLCSSLEPGKDGVGDYCRKMAGNLIMSGNEVIIIALNDKYLPVDEVKEKQSDEQQEITCFRNAHSVPWQKKIKNIKRIVAAFNPDWLSLQYVPYGFNKKGLPFYLPKALQRIAKGYKWHIMFHEMWIGINPNSSAIHKVYGLLQRNIAARLIKALQPAVVTTTNLLYQLELQDKNINAYILPLMSNISRFNKDTLFLSEAEKNHSISFFNGEYYFIGIFGTLYVDAKMPQVVPQFIQNLKTNKKIVVISFGKNNNPGDLNKLKINLRKPVKFIELGELSDVNISCLLSVLNIAILCTPKEYVGKSGAYAALRLHEVEVITPSSVIVPKYQNQIEAYNKFLQERAAEEWSGEFVVKEFCKLLLNS